MGTTHTLIFTIINAEGNPVPGLPLNYSINPLDGTAATATFNPATATTNQDGKVYAEITFGPNPGDLRLYCWEWIPSESWSLLNLNSHRAIRMLIM